MSKLFRPLHQINKHYITLSFTITVQKYCKPQYSIKIEHLGVGSVISFKLLSVDPGSNPGQEPCMWIGFSEPICGFLLTSKTELFYNNLQHTGIYTDLWVTVLYLLWRVYLIPFIFVVKPRPLRKVNLNT